MRAAINHGNPVLARRAPDGTLSGVTVDLAREFARRSGEACTLVPFEAAGKIVDCAGADVWDIAFLAGDPKRAETITFTRPYLEIAGVFVVPQGSAATAPGDLDRAGARIGVGDGAAYDLHLSRTFAKAEFVRYPTSAAVLTGIARDNLDAGASIGQPAAQFVRENPAFRVVAEPFMKIRQAVAVPRRDAAKAGWIDARLGELLAAGFVRDSLARMGEDPALALDR
ncbi:MAG: transporter substrate-binding domain-containing protein [Alphaproteobacteria bacterium]|nr:transporter substrate-binding domain-containing protein [Alphaproteobacteria bacterium]